MSSIDNYLGAIKAYDGPPVKLMEVCGTHTHNIFRYGIPAILPSSITLISGPGCPVCVTPAEYIDRAAKVSLQEGCTLCTFGDMVRVPGHKTSLSDAKAAGGSVKIMYSPMEVLDWAKKEPDETFYVTAVGFETTLPIYALLLERILENGLPNIKMLISVKALMPALYWICDNNPNISGFIGPGHVSTIIGWGVYEPLCKKYGIPFAVGGFGYEHIIAAIYDLIQQNRFATCDVHNLYPNAVSREGNQNALSLISKYFTKKPSTWRGLGEIDGSGYFLSSGYEKFDGGSDIDYSNIPETSGCLCGSVITGRAKPVDCAFFAKGCSPERPLGPCMVSSEGTCGIWYRNGAKGKDRL